MTAADTAQKRLEQYLNEQALKTFDPCFEKWRLYTLLLEQAKNFTVDASGFIPSAYREDQAEAKRRNEALSPCA